MKGNFQNKYRKILDILPDVAKCIEDNLILVGGTALAIFYLKHRASVDLDFVPIKGSDVAAKEKLKGELSKRGYQTLRSAYANQFVIQFEDASIKVEIFVPDDMVLGKPSVFNIEGKNIFVASLNDLLEMKLKTYARRKEARDLYDIFSIPKQEGGGEDIIRILIKKHGKPKNIDELRGMVFDSSSFSKFVEVINDVA